MFNKRRYRQLKLQDRGGLSRKEFRRDSNKHFTFTVTEKIYSRILSNQGEEMTF